MSYGIPVVTSPVGNRGYNFKNKEEIIISSIEAFPDKIRELMTDRNLYKKLESAGKKIAYRYTWDLLGERVITLYKELL
jgi:glycosyltransferase involved in cell wall biosynthesis